MTPRHDVDAANYTPATLVMTAFVSIICFMKLNIYNSFVILNYKHLFSIVTGTRNGFCDPLKSKGPVREMT